MYFNIDEEPKESKEVVEKKWKEYVDKILNYKPDMKSLKKIMIK
mgnify:FL=1